jgi:hypothetical protein
MEPSIPTEEFERARRPSPPAEATIEFSPQSAQPPRQASVEFSRPAVSSTGAHCAACGAPLAPDQRYCVECGQRSGPTRPPFLEHVVEPQQASSSSSPPRRKLRIHPNTALIAGIGTLMLAMATGVLIGRTSAPTSSKGIPVQYIAAPTGSVPSTTSTTPSSAEGGSGGGGHSSSKASPSNVAAKILKGKAPPKAVVKVGTPGRGPGYQKGHFTGKFFGASNSKKQEEEEELGE